MLAAILQEEKAKEVKDLDLDLEQDLLTVEKVLGVQWCVQSDRLKFRINNQLPTKRNTLSIVRSVYVSMGILVPVVLPAQRILQELCRLRFSLDEVLPTQVAEQWFNWIKELQLLSEFRVEWCFKPAHFGKPTFAQLHNFCDACVRGLWHCDLLSSAEQVHCTFVIGKTM